MTTDLMGQLWKPQYEIDEFVTVLMSHYGTSNGSAEQHNIGPQDSPSLVLDWRKNGAIATLRPGPSFNPADVPILQDKLDAALLNRERTVRRYVVTTRRPLLGAIGMEGWFALLPAPPDAPRPTQDYAGGHPAILEVMVDGSTDGMITWRRAYRSLVELESLFAAVLREDISRLPSSGRHFWALNPNDHSRPVFTQTSYQIPDFAAQADALSDIGPFDDVPHIPADDYLFRPWLGGNAFCLPDTLPTLFHHFRALKGDQRRKFLLGAYWAKIAPELWHTSQTAAFAATVRAIEALMPDAPLGEPCDACGSKPSRQLRQGFAQFVDEHCSGITQKQRLAFYDRRSKLVHGKALLSFDEDMMGDTGPRYLVEMGDQHALTQICQVVFHNWLICQQTTA